MSNIARLTEGLTATTLRQKAGQLIKNASASAAEKISRPFSGNVEAKLGDFSARVGGRAPGELQGEARGVATAIKLFKDAKIPEGVFGKDAHQVRLGALKAEAEKLEKEGARAAEQLATFPHSRDPIMWANFDHRAKSFPVEAKGIRDVIAELSKLNG